MTRALFSVLMLSAIGLSGGCHVCQGLHHKIQNRHGHACHEGCGHDCAQGACGCASGHCETGQCAAGHCASGHCGGHGGDGHPDLYEPLHLGHQGPPERCGVLSWLGHDHPPGHSPIPEQAQPAPGPSAAGVSYPYYTNRGPRDFLARDPRGIGPNY